jgi:hypothetical protein
MKIKLIFCLLSICIVTTSECYPCSTFSATVGNSNLAGNSEDWNDLNSMVKFFPSQSGRFGKFIFGFEDWGLSFCSWGGVNDQGLFYDWLSTTQRNPDFHATGTINYSGILADKMLDECATVDEAIALFQRYNCPGIGGAHIFVADRFGNSVVMEEGENNTVAVIRRNGNYQVATNFLNAYLSDPEMYRWVQCPRYEYIDQTLRDTDTISVELYKSILYHVGNNGNMSPTIYSNIYDFNTGKMYIYNYYNFEEVLVLDIDTELAKGFRFLKLPDLFSKVKAEYPENQAVINSPSVEFRWTGDAIDYELWIAEDEQFSNPVIISYSAPEMQEADFGSVISLIFVLFLLVGVIKNRKLQLTFVLTVMLLAGCEDLFTNVPGSQSGMVHVKNFDNLEAGKVYCWKIVAINAKGFQTETSVQRFTTSNF